MYTGQFIYCGKKAQLAVGNVMPIGKLFMTKHYCLS
jgi:large subunit ribosomal protein L8e